MRNIAVAAAVACLLNISFLHAQRTQPQEVYKILGIAVEGNFLSDPLAIIANTGLKVGDEFVIPGDVMGSAIRKLWSLGILEDVEITIDRQVGDGVYLLIKLKELPRFERLEITGNDAIDDDDIMKKLTLDRGKAIKPTELVKIKKDLKQLYESEGFFLAEIKVTTTPVDTIPGRVVVHIDIDEGKEVEVASIAFEGNGAFEDGDLASAMEETGTNAWWQFWSSANFDRKKYEEDKRLVLKFYRKHGYRDAEITSDSIWYSDDKEEMHILMRVHEGAQYKIRRITWEGNAIYADNILNQRLNIAPGDVYNAEKFEQNLRGNEAQTDVASLYLDNGYLRFNLEPREVRVGEDSIDINIRVYEQNQFRIGHVTIKGNTKTHDDVIRRELYTRPGDFFNRGAIIRSARQLSVLNYFNPEKIRPDYNLVNDNTVDVSFEVEEKSSDNVNASIGYSGAYGVTGALGFTINNFSITEPLNGGAGQILNFEWQFGTTTNYRTFTVGFTEPWLYGSPTLFGVSLFDTRQAYSYDLRQTGGSIRVGRRFKWPDAYFRGDWILNGQYNDVSNGRGVYAEGKSTQVSLTQIISRNSVDNPVFPTFGSNVSFSVELSGGPFLPGDIDFLKYNFQAEWYVPLFNSSRVALYLNSQFGYLSEFSTGIPIPPIELFFMGGTGLGYISTTPLRGYEEQSIGPRNANFIAVGGRAMVKQTAELRTAISISPIPIYFLTFVEGGNVYETLSRADFFSLERSAGFGARLQLPPIGLIGFDYAYGFDDVLPRDGKPDGWHFHFIFGRGF